VCVFQGLLIESLGRRALIIGGYSLMSLCCVCFTVALTFQVNRSIKFYMLILNTVYLLFFSIYLFCATCQYFITLFKIKVS